MKIVWEQENDPLVFPLQKKRRGKKGVLPANKQEVEDKAGAGSLKTKRQMMRESIENSMIFKSDKVLVSLMSPTCQGGGPPLNLKSQGIVFGMVRSN